MCCCRATRRGRPVLPRRRAAPRLTSAAAKTQLDALLAVPAASEPAADLPDFRSFGAVELLRRSRFVRIPARSAMRQAPRDLTLLWSDPWHPRHNSTPCP